MTKLLRIICLCVLGVGTLAVQAEDAGFSVVEARSELLGDQWVLSLASDLKLPKRPAEALSSGLALYFQVDIELRRNRKFWFPQVLLDRSIQYRVSYRNLTNRYLVQYLDTGEERFFPTLETALAEVGRLVAYPLLPRAAIENPAETEIEVLVALDATQLPAPLRPTSFLSSDWRMSTPPAIWTLQ